MRKLLTVAAFALVVQSCFGQFSNRTAAFPYATALSSNQTFIIDAPGVTNYNVRAGQLLQLMVQAGLVPTNWPAIAEQVVNSALYSNLTYYGNGLGLTGLLSGNVTYPSIMDRFTRSNRVLFMGHSWFRSSSLTTNIINSPYYAGRVSEWTNASINGSDLLWGSGVNPTNSNGWLVYTQGGGRDFVLATPAGEFCDVHILFGLNDLSSDWDVWMNNYSNFCYQVVQDGGRPIVYTSPYSGLNTAPNTWPGGFRHQQLLMRNRIMREMMNPDTQQPMWFSCVDIARYFQDNFDHLWFNSDRLHLNTDGYILLSSVVNSTLMAGQTFAPEDVMRQGGMLWSYVMAQGSAPQANVNLTGTRTNHPWGSINFFWPDTYTNYLSIVVGTNSDPNGTIVGRQGPGSLYLGTNGAVFLKTDQTNSDWNDYWAWVANTNAGAWGWEQLATREWVTANDSGGVATTNASDITTGTLDDDRLSANVPLLPAANNVFDGVITASQFAGDGSLLTGIEAASGIEEDANGDAMLGEATTGGSSSSTTNETPSVSILLPSALYATEGNEHNTYFWQTIRANSAAYPYTLRVTGPASLGTQWADWYRFTPTAATASNATLTFSVYQSVTNLLATKSVTLKITGATNGAGVSRKFLEIGDSTGVNLDVTEELQRMGGTNVAGLRLSAVGTQGAGTNVNEAYSGTTYSWMYSSDTSPFCESPSTFFDLNFYLTNTSQTMASNDFVILKLGINDAFPDYETDVSMRQALTNSWYCLSNIVERITNYNPGLRIGICVPIPPAYSQDAFGDDYKTTYHTDRYLRNNQFFSEYLCTNAWPAQVTVVSVRTAIDAAHNFPTTTAAYSARNTNTWSYQSNGVHPDTSGYLQIADAIWAWMKGME